MRKKLAAACVVAACLLVGGCAEGGEDASPRSDRSAEAMLECERGIRARMKDPDSVKVWEYKAVSESANAWFYDIDFTATSGFGGPVREVWRCVVTVAEDDTLDVKLISED